MAPLLRFRGIPHSSSLLDWGPGGGPAPEDLAVRTDYWAGRAETAKVVMTHGRAQTTDLAESLFGDPDDCWRGPSAYAVPQEATQSLTRGCGTPSSEMFMDCLGREKRTTACREAGESENRFRFCATRVRRFLIRSR